MNSFFAPHSNKAATRTRSQWLSMLRKCGVRSQTIMGNLSHAPARWGLRLSRAWEAPLKPCPGMSLGVLNTI